MTKEMSWTIIMKVYEIIYNDSIRTNFVQTLYNYMNLNNKNIML